MTSNNYITILGWMTNLNLKGNELIVYAIIHGFSQDNNSYFHGSLNYLTQWTGTSEQCIVEIIKKLVNKGLLEKITREGKTNYYRTINPFELEKDCCNQSDKQSKPKNDNKKDYTEEVTAVITYLNNKLHSRYRIQNPTTTKLIVSKLNSGFTVQDLIQVINTKYDDWYGNSDFEKYLRPSTLFGNKFENYLNQPISTKTSSYSLNNNINNIPTIQKNDIDYSSLQVF